MGELAVHHNTLIPRRDRNLVPVIVVLLGRDPGSLAAGPVVSRRTGVVLLISVVRVAETATRIILPPQLIRVAVIAIVGTDVVGP